jgi:UDP-N-acetyl-D-glucosamine dehydrogenase
MDPNSPPLIDHLMEAIESRSARVGVIGLGYVGLPLATACAAAGFPTSGFDIDPEKAAKLNGGESYIDAVSSADLSSLVTKNMFVATDDFSGLSACQLIVICVPTPLSQHREPDLTYVEATAHTMADRLQNGQLIVLESTSYPGTTRDVLTPILEQGGKVCGRDFFVGFSPEREDPGNKQFSTVTIPKVVAGDGPNAARAVEAFYGSVMQQVVLVSSPDVAEAVKITENVFRAVNIALVNELKVVYDAMGIDVWEVIDAAKTKPFGYMPFYPGPGLGGHCIPIDPFYLSWKAREHGVATRFIELAGEINVSMPNYVIRRLEAALDRHLSKSLGSSRILIVGLAYKKNVGDVRESPSLKLIELIENRGAKADYHDSHVPTIPPTREYKELAGRVSVDLTEGALQSYDAVLIATEHDGVDYQLLAKFARVVVDTRNALGRRGLTNPGLVKA